MTKTVTKFSEQMLYGLDSSLEQIGVGADPF
ncbi:MAG: hypothetical protein LZF62_350081 [Nitrospira sp.]|nr:MAG: hypothetical protein LZF62_350081 [Nitrospira sp.]